MNLVKFLLIGAILSISLGEFGKFPFGSSGFGVSALDMIVFLADIFYIIWNVSTNKSWRFLDRYVFLMLFWMVGGISLVYSLTNFQIDEVLVGSGYLFRFIVYSFSLIITYNLIESKTITINEVVNSFLTTGFIVCLVGFLQYVYLPDFTKGLIILSDFGYDPHFQRLTSTFLDPNFAGGFLVVIFGLGLYKFICTKSWRWSLYLLVILAGIILTFSRSAYLMMVTSLALLFLLNLKRLSKRNIFNLLCLVVVLLVVIASYIPRVFERVVSGLTIDRSSSERFVSWSAGIEVFRTSPIIGVGFNNLRAVQDGLNLFKTYSAQGGHSGGGIDSSFLVVMATTGIAGFVMYMLFWFKVLQRVYKNSEFLSRIIFCLIIGMFVQSQFINSLFFPSLMLTYFVLLGTVDHLSGDLS